MWSNSSEGLLEERYCWKSEQQLENFHYKTSVADAKNTQETQCLNRLAKQKHEEGKFEAGTRSRHSFGFYYE